MPSKTADSVVNGQLPRKRLRVISRGIPKSTKPLYRAVRIILSIGNKYGIKWNMHRISTIVDIDMFLQIVKVDIMDRGEVDNGQIPIIIGKRLCPST